MPRNTYQDWGHKSTVGIRTTQTQAGKQAQRDKTKIDIDEDMAKQLGLVSLDVIKALLQRGRRGYNAWTLLNELLNEESEQHTLAAERMMEGGFDPLMDIPQITTEAGPAIEATQQPALPQITTEAGPAVEATPQPAKKPAPRRGTRPNAGKPAERWIESV